VMTVTLWASYRQAKKFANLWNKHLSRKPETKSVSPLLEKKRFFNNSCYVLSFLSQTFSPPALASLGRPPILLAK